MFKETISSLFNRSQEEEDELIEDETINTLENGFGKLLNFLIKEREPLKPSSNKIPAFSPIIFKQDINTLINHDKYNFEDQHEVETKDGYKLKLHRIKKKYSNPENAEYKDVVFLQHGLADSSVTWFMDENGLAFTLADAGYDVWLGNVRGNIYSTGHVKYDKDSDNKYWDFTWDDMASKDLPTMIDYVLELTRRPNLHYVGHSQGGLIGFVELSRNPKLTSQVKHFFALAPAVYLGNMASPIRLLIDAKYYILRLLYFIITLEFLPWDWPKSILTSIFKYPSDPNDINTAKRINYDVPKKKSVKQYKQGIWEKPGFRFILSFFYHFINIITGLFLCFTSYAKNVYERIILNFMMALWQLLLGKKGLNTNMERFLKVFPALEKLYKESGNKETLLNLTCGKSESLTNEKLNHCFNFYPCDSSIKNLLHFMQLVRSGRPATFNNGLSVKNNRDYQQPDPIPFNVRNIDPEKCTIFFGDNDLLVPANDIAIKLRNCSNDINLIFGFNHVDFVWSPQAKEKVYSKIIYKMQHENI